MAIKKKSVTPKAPPAPLVTGPSIIVPRSDFNVLAIRSVTEQTRLLADAYEDEIEKLSVDHTVPQRLMRAVLDSEKLALHANRFKNVFEVFALEHRKGPGGFVHEAEDGEPLVVIGFSMTGGAISPKWKDEAIRLAGELANERGQKFDPDVFEAEVRARTTPSKTNTKVALTEAG